MTDGVMITGARAPVALHMAWALRATGQRVVLADTLRHPIGQAAGLADGYLRFTAPRHDLPGFRRDMLELCRSHRIGTVVPTCEEVFWLAQIADDLTAAGVCLLAPPLPVLRAAHDKAAFIAGCAGFWPHLPATRHVTSAADLDASLPHSADLVFKPAFSRFATRTLIRPAAARVRALTPTATDPWVVQQFIAGREVCAFAIARHGCVRALAVYHPLYRAGLGAGIYFQPVDPGPALRFVQAFCTATGWDGQVSFDLIEAADGLYPIECNPRATSGLHLMRDAAAMSRALLPTAPSPDDPPLLIEAATPPQCVKLAMWLYAAWPNRHRLRLFRADLAAATEALAWADGSRVRLSSQIRAVAEIGRTALARRISLQQAATEDIEWNGP